MPGSLGQDPSSAEELVRDKTTAPRLEIQLFQQMRYYKSGIWGLSFGLQSMAQQIEELKSMYTLEMKRKKICSCMFSFQRK